jgi:hypothetical protein
LKRDLDLKIDLTYSRTSTVTQSSQRLPQEDGRDNMRLNTSASLRFTRTMSGTFGLELGQERQPTRDFSRRSVRVYFSTGFSF